MRMELPPGWRGYGARDYIEHPDTAAAQAEINALRRSRHSAERCRRPCCRFAMRCRRALRAATSAYQRGGGG
jgi:hypothetical protein